MLNRPVYVVGVGIHRFGKHDVSRRDMAFTAGMGAMDHAGIDFRQIGYLDNGYIGGSMMEGSRFCQGFRPYRSSHRACRKCFSYRLFGLSRGRTRGCGRGL